MDEVTNLLILYGGAMLFSTVLSALSWARYRTLLHRTVLSVWASALCAFVIQGILQHGQLLLAIGFSSVFLLGASLALLMARVADIKFSWRPSLILLGISYPTMLALHFSGASFTWFTLPIAIAAAFPMVHAGVEVVRSGRWSQLSLSGKGLLLSLIPSIAHTLDYPLLRQREEFASLGFTIAILIVFSLSIFAPAVSLELATNQQARTAAELAIAQRIQLELLPKQPTLDGLEIACYMKPAEEVGGDYYDIYRMGGHTWLLLGDVTGHGLSAGLVMLMAQSAISAILHTRPEITPGELNWLANRILHQNLRRLNEQRSMTIVSICRHPDGRFVFSGNHENLYIFRERTGTIDTIDVSQVPHGLGMLDEFGREEFAEGKFQLEPGDLLFIGTDGVREAAQQGDYRRGMFDEERIVAFLRSSRGASLEVLRQRLIDELERFTGGVFHDDVTFLLVRALPA